MSDPTKRPDPLEQDFAALKSRTTPPGDDLMARVLADAQDVQAGFMAQPVAPKEPALTRFMALIGGWPWMAGIATAGIAGVWVGMAQPAILVAGSQALLYGDAGAVLNDFDAGFGLSDLDGGL